MSDGPYCSLPMRPAWKKVAEKAENEAFDRKEVSEAIECATEKDWHRDVPKALVSSARQLLCGEEEFSGVTLRSIDELRQSFPGCVMGNTFLEYLEIAVEEGMRGTHALKQAVVGTLNHHSGSCKLQIEEHYLQESNAGFSRRVRQRIEDAEKVTGFAQIADRVIEPGSRRMPSRRMRDGIEEGVKIR